MLWANTTGSGTTHTPFEDRYPVPRPVVSLADSASATRAHVKVPDEYDEEHDHDRRGDASQYDEDNAVALRLVDDREEEDAHQQTDGKAY